MKKTAKQRRAAAKAFDAAVGARLRTKRVERSMTQAQLAACTDFSESQIGRYETGETTTEPATLAKLAAIFGCKASDLIDGIEVRK